MCRGCSASRTCSEKQNFNFYSKISINKLLFCCFLRLQSNCQGPYTIILFAVWSLRRRAYNLHGISGSHACVGNAVARRACTCFRKHEFLRLLSHTKAKCKSYRTSIREIEGPRSSLVSSRPFYAGPAAVGTG